MTIDRRAANRDTGPPAGCFEESFRIETPAVDPHTHTMPSDVLERYVTETKLSPDQRMLLDNAIQCGYPIEVHGIYDPWTRDFLAAHSFEIEQGPYERTAPGRGATKKEFNYLRPSALELSRPSGDRVVCFVVFPSHEYVHQYAEVIATYAAIMKTRLGVAYELPVVRVHYPTLEDDIAGWSHLRADLATLEYEPSLTVMGEVTLIRNALLDLDFPQRSEPTALGIDAIFSLERVMDQRGDRAVYLFGARHSYLGSAAGQIARALAEAGAKHIIYAAKAGTFRKQEHVHENFSPTLYALLSESPRRLGHIDDMHLYHLDSPFHRLKGFPGGMRTGIHLTVPTVVGETQRQWQAYEQYTPTTIDNETGFIVRALHELNEAQGQDVWFTALHFVTDYLRDPKTATTKRSRGDLTLKSPAYDAQKQTRFVEIARIISTYAILADTTRIDHPDGGRQWRYSIVDIINAWQECKQFISGLDARRYSSRRLIEFLLRSRYAAYYNGDVVWGLHEMQQACHDYDVRALEPIAAAFEIVRAYYEVFPGRRDIEPKSHRELLAIAGRAEALAARLEHPYARYVMAVTQLQSLLHATRGQGRSSSAEELAFLSELCSNAQRNLDAAGLAEQDRMFEMTHLERVRAFVENRKGATDEAVARFQDSLQRWEALCPRFGDETRWIPIAEIALNKIDLLLNGFASPDPHWTADIEEAQGHVLGRFDLIGRLARSVNRKEVVARLADHRP